MKVEYVDRKTGKLKEEKVPGDGGLHFLYHSALGKFFLELMIKRKFASSLYGKYQDTERSSRKIKSFIEEQNIDMNDYLVSDYRKYRTFNDFFYRKIDPEKRPMPKDKNILISPADSRALFYENINQDFLFPVKGYNMNLKNLLMNDELCRSFSGGSLAVFRLCPSDYHRFHFIDDCLVKKEKFIDGDYYSVNPIALDSVEDLFSKNKRNLTLLETENFGDMIYIEVGATFVGSIIQTYNSETANRKGDEKGYFKFGGSTVILLFQNGKVNFDRDLIENSQKGLETYVKAREKIGSAVLT